MKEEKNTLTKEEKVIKARHEANNQYFNDIAAGMQEKEALHKFHMAIKNTLFIKGD